MSDLDVEPWAILANVKVPTPHARRKYGVDIEWVQLPYAAAATAEDLLDVCRIAAEVNLYRIAVAMGAVDEDE